MSPKSEKKESSKQGLQEILNELKSEYLHRFPQKLIVLEELTRNKKWKELHEEYHKLKGTGKTYGVPEISKLAQCLEDLAFYLEKDFENSLQVELFFELGISVFRQWVQSSFQFNILEFDDALKIVKFHKKWITDRSEQ